MKARRASARIPAIQMAGNLTNDFASRAIVVLGVARSGTSAVAGALHHLGVRMCEDIHRGEPNPTGTFEDKQFLWRGLQLQGVHWHFIRESVRGYADAIRERNHSFVIWGIKEPRFMFCWPAYIPLFEDIRCVIVRRSPAATEQSFAKWEAAIDGPPLDEQRGQMKVCIDWTDQLNISTHTIWYEELLSHPATSIQALAEWAFQGLHIKPEPDHIQQAVEFVDPKLRHY